MSAIETDRLAARTVIVPVMSFERQIGTAYQPETCSELTAAHGLLTHL